MAASRVEQPALLGDCLARGWAPTLRSSGGEPAQRTSWICQPFEQFEQGQHQAGVAARCRFDAVIGQVLGIEFAHPLQKAGWAQ